MRPEVRCRAPYSSSGNTPNSSVNTAPLMTVWRNAVWAASIALSMICNQLHGEKYSVPTSTDSPAGQACRTREKAAAGRVDPYSQSRSCHIPAWDTPRDTAGLSGYCEPVRRALEDGPVHRELPAMGMCRCFSVRGAASEIWKATNPPESRPRSQSHASCKARYLAGWNQRYAGRAPDLTGKDGAAAMPHHTPCSDVELRPR